MRAAAERRCVVCEQEPYILHEALGNPDMVAVSIFVCSGNQSGELFKRKEPLVLAVVQRLVEESHIKGLSLVLRSH